MIGWLRGTLREKNEASVLINVGGVGYEVEMPTLGVARLPANGEEAELHCHMVVRDDRHELFGFVTRDERDVFRELIKVNGVGPRLGVAILSGLDAGQLARCVREGDLKALQAMPGVGKKTAERVMIDLRDKLDVFAVGLPEPTHAVPAGSAFEDAEEALIGLGFRPAEAARALAQLDDPPNDTEALIRLSLKGLGRD
ncbi:MAG: Holliday junction branch migration protein RuvA [Gammaproteobacteria bacterium]|nr:Holliday junction branch migration protein RuvA [Gammaproteobacteria bacterium]